MGFSIEGLLLVIAVLLPNLLVIVFPPQNVPEGPKDAGIVLTVLERIGQAGCFLLPPLSKDYFKAVAVDVWFILTLISIAVYISLWIRYAFKRDYEYLFKPLLFIPVPMAVFPVCAFAFMAVWIQSLWLGLAVLVLGIGHLANSYHSYQCIMGDKHD